MKCPKCGCESSEKPVPDWMTKGIKAWEKEEKKIIAKFEAGASLSIIKATKQQLLRG